MAKEIAASGEHPGTHPEEEVAVEDTPHEDRQGLLQDHTDQAGQADLEVQDSRQDTLHDIRREDHREVQGYARLDTAREKGHTFRLQQDGR